MVNVTTGEILADISLFEWRRRPVLGAVWANAAIADRCLALLLMPVVLTTILLLIPVLLVSQGRPIFYRSERMTTTDRAFQLWKIRTMTVAARRRCSVLGGDMAGAVTPVGQILRRFRLDELPQIFNVLKGDMRFIGPRPPLRKYVEAYPEIYARVLQMKPGITGLATVILHKREDRILSRCQTGEASDAAYREFCIVPKARLDLLYQRRRSTKLDAFILFRTVAGLLPLRPTFLARKGAAIKPMRSVDGQEG